jgi:hypothetical protein
MSSSEGQKKRSEAVISSISSAATESSSSTADTHCLRGLAGGAGWASGGSELFVRHDMACRDGVPGALGRDPPLRQAAVVPADVEEDAALRVAGRRVLLHVRALLRLRQRPRPAVGRVPQGPGVVVAVGWPRAAAGQHQRAQR